MEPQIEAVAQAYSSAERASDPHALPNVEIFAVSPLEANYNALEAARSGKGDEYTVYEPGWYWWSCFPGCLPDSDANGPHASYAEALADAQEVAA